MNESLPSIFPSGPEQWSALVPYLWLCAGIALATVAAGMRASTNAVRMVCGVVFVPFSVLNIVALREPTVMLFSTALEISPLTRAIGAALGLLAFASSLYMHSTDSERRPEWGVLLMISLLGMSLLPASRDWVTFFVNLETLAIAGYMLAALDTGRVRSLEASLKYVLMGAFASGIFLMGIVLLYGATGTFDYAGIARSVSLAPSQLAFLGAFLVLIGLAFKVALAPFHMWAADVYQGTPTAVGSFLAGATKLCVFVAMMIAFHQCGFYVHVPFFPKAIVALSVLSIFLGNLLAIAQTKLRRMLAYSSVANAGYAGLALAMGPQSLTALFTSLALYACTLVAAFSMTEILVREVGKDPHGDIEISELGRIRSQTSRSVLWILGIALFSLAGMPPFPGFFGKYLVLQDLWQNGMLVESVALIIGTLLGLGYYLRVFVPLSMGPIEKEESAGTPAPWWGLGSRGAFASGVLATLLLILAMGGFSRLVQWVDYIEGLAR